MEVTNFTPRKAYARKRSTEESVGATFSLTALNINVVTQQLY